MSDLLKKYLDESCCSHCFNIDSECNRCVEKLLAEHDANVRADGESIGITRVLDILEHLDEQVLEKVKDALYEQDYTEFKEQK